VHLVEHKSLIIITKDIKEGKYKEQVEAIRKLIAEGQEEEADKLKKQLWLSLHQAHLKMAVKLNCFRNTANM
jgi:Arc/MetJ-type ribon-helix-helix transcriptional regulator